MATKGNSVTYVDPFGKEHDALVLALNGLNEGFLTLAYVDTAAPESSNLVVKYDVAHMSDSSKDESNPNLPRYVVNAWKEAGDSHLAPPADHVMFDHPFKTVEVDQDGIPLPVARPQFEAEVAAHNAEPDVTAQLDAAPPAPEEPEPPAPEAPPAA